MGNFNAQNPSPRGTTLLDLLETVIAAQFEAEAAGKTM